MISAEMCVRELGARASDEFSPTGVAEAAAAGAIAAADDRGSALGGCAIALASPLARL
jgi:hypothetical protein